MPNSLPAFSHQPNRALENNKSSSQWIRMRYKLHIQLQGFLQSKKQQSYTCLSLKTKNSQILTCEIWIEKSCLMFPSPNEKNNENPSFPIIILCQETRNQTQNSILDRASKNQRDRSIQSLQ